MSPYLIIPLGWLLGQLLFIVVMSVATQKNKNNECSFNDAFIIYVRHDTGPIWVAVLIMLIAMFILPEIIAHHAIANGPLEDVKESKYIQKIVEFLRTFSVLLGIAAQGIGFLIVSRAGKWIKKADDKP